MSNKTSVYRKPKFPENGYPPYLGELSGAGRGHSSFSGGKGKLQFTITDDRAGVCRCKREIWNAIYAVPRTEKSQHVGKAKICCHESEKTGDVEVERSFMEPLFQNTYIHNEKEPLSGNSLIGVL